MDTSNLNNLDLTLDRLIREYQKLLKENQRLRQQLATLSKDQLLLADKNQMAVVRIKNVINQLREEIHERIL